MGALSSLATLGLELALAQKAREEEKDRLEEQRRQEIRRIRLTDAEEQRRQQAALARRLAQERARAGAMGISGSGGSIDAVLRGLEEESRALQEARGRETAARIAAVRDRYEGRTRRSLLEGAGQWTELGSRALGGFGSSRRSLLD
jgi:homoserine kinase